MEADWARVARFPQLHHGVLTYPAFGQRATFGQPPLPVEVLEIDHRDMVTSQGQFVRPRQAAFDRRMEEVEIPGQFIGPVVLHQHRHIPDAGADELCAGMILITWQDADLAAEGDQVAQFRLDGVELIPVRLAGHIAIPPHAIARNAERARGAQNLLCPVVRVDRVDVGRHQRDLHAALLESFDEFRQVFLDARRLDMPTFTHWCLDAFEAERSDGLGELVVREADEVLREEAEFRGFRRGRSGEHRAEHCSRQQRTGKTQHRAAGEHRLTS